MDEQKIKIKSFTGLFAWQEGHKLVLMIYNTTEQFPDKERFGLISQTRRAAVSITSNIAEGFSRKTNKDKVQFYAMAQGSLTELQNQL
ncbi:MAG: four helix bundle protein, partial [bacterium]